MPFTLRIAFGMIGLGALAACSGGEVVENAAPAVEAPTDYTILPAHLYGDLPKDICRYRDRDFLQKLIQRAKAAVPPEQHAAFRFEDFGVSDDYAGKGREATLRFRVSEPGGEEVLMFATGPFDPENCTVSDLRVGVGASPYAAEGKMTRVP